MICANCFDSGTVCENHPDHPWVGLADVEPCCGGAGMPCPVCCTPVPMDGTHSSVEAFTPWYLRGDPLEPAPTHD